MVTRLSRLCARLSARSDRPARAIKWFDDAAREAALPFIDRELDSMEAEVKRFDEWSALPLIVLAGLR